MRRLRQRSASIMLVLLLAVALFAAPGCGKKVANPDAVPGDPSPGESTPGASPDGTPPAEGATLGSRPRPDPYVGTGLPDPYINDEGEIELIFADARGTVKLGAGKGSAAGAVLSADRMKLAYTVAPPSEGESYQDDRVYIVDAAVEPWEERELSSARNYPICELAFSPCGQYLSVDAGTSVVRSLRVIRISDGALLVGAGVFSRAVWSPGTPSRLAMGLMTNRSIAPLTELDRTVDAVIVDLPSGRVTCLKKGTATGFWAPREWTAHGKIELSHTVIIPRSDSMVSVDVPPRLAATDTAPSGSGPLSQDADPRPERNLAGELLLSAPDGTVLRQLTDRSRGFVVDYATSSDGRTLVYTWQGTNEDYTRLFRVSLPDLSTDEVNIGSHGRGVTGHGPCGLAFAPGSRLLLLADWGCGFSRVHDLDMGTVSDLFGVYPLWVPEELAGKAPLVVLGQGPAGNRMLSMGEGFGLSVYDASSGARTVLADGSDTVSYYPLGFEDGAILALKEGATEPQIVRMPMPE